MYPRSSQKATAYSMNPLSHKSHESIKKPTKQCSELRTMSARTSATDRAFVWSKPSSKRHVRLQTVRWPSRKGDLS
jgi:phage-related protein